MIAPGGNPIGPGGKAPGGKAPAGKAAGIAVGAFNGTICPEMPSLANTCLTSRIFTIPDPASK
jgi:hypothetical protein